MEHHSNIVPWQLLAQEEGRDPEVRRPEPRRDPEYRTSLRSCSQSRPRLVAVTHCSNVLGTINDVAKICAKARKAGAVTVVDGAQSVPTCQSTSPRSGATSTPSRVTRCSVRLASAFSSDRKELLEDMDPFQGGGEMIREVFLDHATWNDVPYKFEAGTVNIADAIGLGAAVDYLSTLGMEKVREHEVRLLRYALEALSRVKGFTAYGPPRAGTDGAASSPSTSATSTHTTLRPYSTRRASPSGRATTAPSRSCAGSTCRRPAGRASTSTTPTTTSTRWWSASRRSGGSSSYEQRRTSTRRSSSTTTGTPGTTGSWRSTTSTRTTPTPSAATRSRCR